jgi:hypothetical protein
MTDGLRHRRAGHRPSAIATKMRAPRPCCQRFYAGASGANFFALQWPKEAVSHVRGCVSFNALSSALYAAKAG